MVQPNRDQELTIPAGFGYVEQYLTKFRATHPHIDRNVFVMMPFSTAASNEIFDAVACELRDHGLVALRADDKAFSPVLWWNIVTYMLGSSYGLVIYEPSGKASFNPNVSIEAGFMLALDRPVLFLVNEQLAGLPVDFAGHIFKKYRADLMALQDSTRGAVRDWIERDLSYYDYGDKKLILFVSLGGTCRCVMGKAILADVIDSRRIPGVVVDAAAIADPHHPTISPSALKAIEEVRRSQWIAGHRPRKLCPYLQDRANLIIVLTDQALARSGRPTQKILTDVELFGEAVPNPYPDNGDDASLKKYRSVRDRLEQLIAKNLDVILERAGARPEI